MLKWSAFIWASSLILCVKALPSSERGNKEITVPGAQTRWLPSAEKQPSPELCYQMSAEEDEETRKVGTLGRTAL
jgi:hypothetical protein